MAVAHALALGSELDPAAARRGLAERQRGSRGRVDLVAVVHLQHLNVEVLAQHAGRLLDQTREQIDAEAEVGGPYNGRAFGGGADRLGLIRIEPGGAEHQGAAALGRESRVSDTRRRHGQIQDLPIPCCATVNAVAADLVPS